MKTAVTAITSIPYDFRGKVRDTYDLKDGRLAIVATDRISSFDIVLPDFIPGKGKVLTAMTEFWATEVLTDIPNHLLSTKVGDLPQWFTDKLTADELEWLEGRLMIVKKADVFPVECIVRGYITGSGLASYQKNGTVCGIELPPGLVEADRLENPIFTPSTKAEAGEHDENISFERMAGIVGRLKAEELALLSIGAYKAGLEHALDRGMILADTKFEFGLGVDGVMLIDEMLTPDSSRFWALEEWVPGRSQRSFDKQRVRDWYDENWPKADRATTPPPHMPKSLIEGTTALYQEAYERLSGRK